MSSPIALIRAAVMAQLSASLNTNLATSCAAFSVPIVAFDFAAGSLNVFQANVGYSDTELSGTAMPNLLCVYGGTAAPFKAGGTQKLFNATWSGNVSIILDLYLSVPGEAVSNFEPYADAGEGAVIATMNNLSLQANFAGSGKLYGLEISAARQKCVLDGENWIVPVRFTAQFEAYIS